MGGTAGSFGESEIKLWDGNGQKIKRALYSPAVQKNMLFTC